MDMDNEPSRKELEELEKMLDKGEYFDEEFDDFDALTNWGDEDDLIDDE